MKVKSIHLVFLFFLSLIFCFYFGSIGVFPIDSFAFFDSANLINKGLIPFEDYWLSSGLLVDYLQSIFFRIFGVNWHSYVLHAVFINFIFTSFTYSFFLIVGLNNKYSLFYSSLTSILSYSVVGVPFPDHHSIFLSIIGFYIFFFLSISKKDYLIGWFFLPIPFFLAFISKQVPASYIILLFFFTGLFYFFRKNNIKKLLYLIIGAFFIILLFYLFLIINKISVNNFLIQYVLFPITIGSSRVSGLTLESLIYKLIGEFKFVSLSYAILFYFFIKSYFNSKKNLILNTNNFLVLFFIIISIIFNQILTKNQNFIFFLIPIILGISHSQLNFFKKERKILVILILLLSIFTTFKYHLRFNIDRKFMELENVDKSKYLNASIISEKLKGLKWINPEFKGSAQKEARLLKNAINYLSQTSNNKIIITEYQFILSDINHNIYSPNRWYTRDGVSYPLLGNKYYYYYKNFFIKILKKNNIEFIYTIYPLDIKSFDFIIEKSCIKTEKISDILIQYDIKNCNL